MERRCPLQVDLVEPRGERGEHGRAGLDAEVLALPHRAERLRRLRHLPLAGRRERALLPVEPVERRLVQLLPGELVQEQQPARAEQGGDPVERGVEIVRAMERLRANHDVVARRLVELLEREPAELLAVWRRGIDPEHVVPCDRERGGQLARTAAELEHARRWLGQMLEHVLVEPDQQPLLSSASPSFSHSVPMFSGNVYQVLREPTIARLPP